MGEKKLSWTEIRTTIASSLGTAFGLVIGLIWNNVVTSGFANAGVSMTGGTGWDGWIVFVITAVIVTLVCVLAIVLLARWSGRAAKK